MHSPHKRRKDTLATFSARSAGYRLESNWISDATVITPLIEQLPSSAKVALDVCAGDGFVADVLQSLGIRAVASDISSDMLSHYRGPKVIADAEILPFGPDSFDFVICRQGIHYLDIDRFLSEIGRISSRVCISEIVMMSDEDFSFWREFFSIVSPGRRHVFSPGEISGWLERSGWHITWQAMTVRPGAYLGSALHLESAMQDYLLDKLRAMPPWRKHANGVILHGGTFLINHLFELIVAERRW
ncbi:class I SAM-dependent methyltransferase [Nocardia wallacei]|uniref:class I SAM-dependent methyltransferase n=1 Tax=Nocardia wallacei TaxID=480035 RepID=UPI0024565D25|nr:class I SAM-dependent methyltransferase [Nocardia wallacei]